MKLEAKGETKHENHNKKIHKGLKYVLPYPDHSEVVNLPGRSEDVILENYREDKKNDFLLADLPILDDDTDLQTSVFLKETAVHKAVGTSDEITTHAATSGSSNSLLSLNARTSEDKAIVIYNPSPNYQNTDENQYMDHPLSLFTAYDFRNWGVGWGCRWLGEAKKEVLFSCKVSRICKPAL